MSLLSAILESQKAIKKNAGEIPRPPEFFYASEEQWSRALAGLKKKAETGLPLPAGNYHVKGTITFGGQSDSNIDTWGTLLEDDAEIVSPFEEKMRAIAAEKKKREKNRKKRKPAKR